MTLLAIGLWPGLAAALVLGLCAGGLTGLPRDRAGLLALGLLGGLLALLAGLATLETVPGQTGLWIETAAIMLAVYLAGCFLGGLGRLFAQRS